MRNRALAILLNLALVPLTAWALGAAPAHAQTPPDDEPTASGTPQSGEPDAASPDEKVPDEPEPKPAPAQPPLGQPTPAHREPSATAPASLRGKLELSLADAIKMGLENNLDVQVDRFAPFIAQAEMGIAWGAYDPEWFSRFGYDKTQTPTANQIISSSPTTTQENLGGAGGFRGLLPLLNTTYSIEIDGNRNTSKNLTFQTLSPELTSSWAVHATQPLMRNLIWSEPWTRVQTTRVLYDSSLEQFRSDVMDTVRSIQDGYWELIATEDDVRVAEKSLETANALLDQTKTQFQVGVVSKVEVVEAEAGVADREFNLIVVKNRYKNAQDTLIDLVLGPHLTADSTLEIAPTDRPQDYIQYEIDPEIAVQRAFEHRPELSLAENEIERSELQLKFAKNQRLPQLDLDLAFGNQGLAGRVNPDCVNFGAGGGPCTTSVNGGFGSTFDNYFTPDAAEQYTARGIFSIPLPNTAARQRVSQSALELRRNRTRKRRLEQTIILEVRKAVRDLKSAQEGIQAAKRATAAAGEQLRAERVRLEYGESTPFNVLLRESDYVQAESQQIVAFRAYRSSVTALDRAQGTILTSNNIAIDAVRALR